MLAVLAESNAAGGPDFYFCDGNHDHYVSLKECGSLFAPGCRFMHRAECLEITGIRHVFFGGAHSSDIAQRREGVNWWPDELPSDEELLRFAAVIREYRPEVIVTHEAPAFASFPTSRPDGDLRNQLRRACETAGFWPERWFFGHHHILHKWKDPSLPAQLFCCGLHGEGWFLDGRPFRPPLLTRSFLNPENPQP